MWHNLRAESALNLRPNETQKTESRAQLIDADGEISDCEADRRHNDSLPTLRYGWFLREIENNKVDAEDAVSFAVSRDYVNVEHESILRHSVGGAITPAAAANPSKLMKKAFCSTRCVWKPFKRIPQKAENEFNLHFGVLSAFIRH